MGFVWLSDQRVLGRRGSHRPPGQDSHRTDDRAGIEWLRNGKPSALGIATGSIAGLAAITPASGTVGPVGALAIGATSAALCWLACAKLKARFGYDDSLDVFGVHGVGGFVGTILLAIFGTRSFAG